MKAVYVENKHEETLDTENDLCLFRAPRKMSTGRKYLKGRDLFLHKLPNGCEIYYLLLWSVRNRQNDEIAQITPAMAKRFLEDRGIICNPRSDQEEKAIVTMQRYGWGILEEF